MRISDTSDSLIELARRLLNLALKQGAEEAEVYGMVGRSVDVDLRREYVEMASESYHSGLGLRAVVDGAVGFSSSSDMSQLEFVAKSAVRSARVRGGDDSWISLPRPERVTEPEGIYDRRLEQITPEECIDIAAGLLAGCQEIRGAEPVSGGVACVSGTGFVLNSQGIELMETSTLMQASMEAIARGEDVATGSEFFNSRRLELSIEPVSRAAGELARSSLGGVRGESGNFDVLLRPLAAAELLEGTLLTSLEADSVQKGRSSLRGRVGEMIASEDFMLIDDGLLPAGIDSSAFDGEGVPSQRTVLVDGGILKGFLYDSYAAGKDGTHSTGNSVRSGYSDLPRVGSRNLIVSSPSAHELQAGRGGYLVHGLIGAHTANPISGDFSVEARNAFRLAPGGEAQPVRSLMLAGNIFEILQTVEVGIDRRSVGSIVTPSLKVRMRVVGS